MPTKEYQIQTNAANRPRCQQEFHRNSQNFSY